MSAMPNMPEPTDFSQQPPLTLNEGFQRPVEEQQVDILDDDEMLRKAAMDPRGSREIAPYGTYGAVEQALENGYYTGLESMDFGTLPDGTPAALFTDKNGQRQAIRMTTQQWFGAMQQRAQARIGMAQQMRKKRDADRLRAPIMEMARELQQVAPGFDQFAAIEMERDPQTAYSTVQDLYARIKAKDEAALQEIQKRVNTTNLQVARMQAESFVNFKTEEYTTQMQGIMSDDSVPDYYKAQMEQHLRIKLLNLQQFGVYAPPDGAVMNAAAFPSYYQTTGNPNAMVSMADMAISDVGRDAIESMPQMLRLGALAARAEDYTRRIGWTRPWSDADRDIAMRYIAQRLSGGLPTQEMSTQYMSAQQLAEAPPTNPQRAMTMGRMAQAATAREKTSREREMAQAKLESEKARAESTRAGARRSEASAAQTEAITGIITQEDQDKYQALREEVLALGYEMPDTGDPVNDIIGAAKDLMADTSREGRARYERFRALLAKYRE